MNKILSVTNLGYKVKATDTGKRIEKEILKDISFDLYENSITALIGESGCGKTTLAKIIAGITEPTAGQIQRSNNLNIQLLFQNSGELIHPLRSVKSILADISGSNSEIEKICMLLGINESILSQKGYSLSGGERQRAGLARVLLSNPGLLILDEPFSSQDPESVIQIRNLLRKINAELKIALFIISHNIQPLRELADDILIMKNGRIVLRGDCENILQKPSNSYIEFLIKAESFSLDENDISSYRTMIRNEGADKI